MQKFFQYSDDAQRATTGFALLLTVAVVGTIVVSSLALAGVAVGCTYAYLTGVTHIEMPVDHWKEMFLDRLVMMGLLTSLAVVGTAVYRIVQWSEDGGRAVARSLGGVRVTDVTDNLEQRKLLNIVEEVAIATASSMPAVYLLEGESGINAFAAGVDAKQAVIGVTQGAVERLQRHQLQGVIAHEFSHILHADIRLNTRLMGVIAGIQAVAFAANFLIGAALRPSKPGMAVQGKHPLGVVLSLIFGCALWPIGQVGVLFAIVLSMAINRHREYLADASAVHYVRDPHGLREALKVVRDDEVGGRLAGPASLLASHMCFASVGRGWQRLFETHPPLDERIERLSVARASHGDSVAEMAVSI